MTSSEDHDEIKRFLIFKRVVPVDVDKENEEEVENILAEFAGQKCTIEYDNSEDELVIVKRLIISSE